jgi:uncharacterized membrane protein YhaH (DUF805 family)
VESGFAVAWSPLRRYADFRGRSTRFELLLFYALLIVINLAIGWAGFLTVPEVAVWGPSVLLLVTACPILALMVRRLHDTGRSARWLLLGLPLLGFTLWEAVVQYRDSLAQSPIDALPVVARLALAMTGVVIAVLLLWDDDESANAYGPNPRYGSVAATA